MAKKNTPKKSVAEKTTTYSTRLNDEQREHLEHAAASLGVSASRFIRDATLRAAADVVNATAPNDRAINAIAQRLVDSILNQQATLGFADEFENQYTEKAILNNATLPMSQFFAQREDEPRRELEYITINTLNKREMRQLTEIAESCPFAFAQAFLKATRGASEPLPEFSARSNPDKLMSE